MKHIPSSIRTLITGATAGTLYSLIGSAAFASGPAQFAPNNSTYSGTGLSTDSPTTIGINVLVALLSVLGLIAVALVIYAGFMMLTSRGNEAQVTKGKQTLQWAVIGIIIILSSLGIVQFLDNAF